MLPQHNLHAINLASPTLNNIPDIARCSRYNLCAFPRAARCLLQQKLAARSLVHSLNYHLPRSGGTRLAGIRPPR